MPCLLSITVVLCIVSFVGEDASLYSSGSLNSGGSVSPSTTEDFTNELQGLSPEERERQKEEWSAELAKVCFN